jgi:uncharacterized membrane protein
VESLNFLASSLVTAALVLDSAVTVLNLNYFSYVSRHLNPKRLITRLLDTKKEMERLRASRTIWDG